MTKMGTTTKRSTTRNSIGKEEYSTIQQASTVTDHNNNADLLVAQMQQEIEQLALENYKM